MNTFKELQLACNLFLKKDIKPDALIILSVSHSIKFIEGKPVLRDTSGSTVINTYLSYEKAFEHIKEITELPFKYPRQTYEVSRPEYQLICTTHP